MAKQEGASFEQILKDLQNKQYKPIYLLMGEEAYYIDMISDYIQHNVLDDMEREFNLTIMYGKDIDNIVNVSNAAKRYPMMAPYQVVIVKEAQMIKKWEDFIYYVENPLNTTILVLCYKYGNLNKTTKVYKAINKMGVVLESAALRDYQMDSWIKNYLRTKSLTIDDKAAALLVEYLGTDLSKVVNELDKLIITKPADQKQITSELIEKNIGISKDYNNFELQNAIFKRDVLKASRIVNHFSGNMTANPLQVTTAVLFGAFTNLMVYHYVPDKKGAAPLMGVNPYFLKDYDAASKVYNAWKCMQNISLIREFDAKSKGVGSRENPAELLKEMVFKLMH